MSNLLYPALPGLEFGTLRSVLAPPVQVRTTPSRREYRARDATIDRFRYVLNYEFLSQRAVFSEAQLDTLTGFFRRHGGSFESFLFADPADRPAAADLFGTGNGSTTVFQLLRAVGGFSEPVYAVNGNIDVTNNGITVSNWTLGPTGIVTFVSPPGPGALLRWFGTPLRRVRFLRDETEAELFMRDLWRAKKVELITSST
jgi:hypothetical protein